MRDELENYITIYKEPIVIESRKPNYDGKRKAEIISKQTGIPISYIYDDSAGNNFVFDRSSDWIKINNKWFFLKDKYNLLDFDDSFVFFNELLGQEISSYFCLETATYMIAKKYKNSNFKYCLLSENFFDKNHDYFSFEDLDINTENTKLEESLRRIKQFCLKNNDTNYLLLQDIIKMSIRDLYASTIDRHKLNFFLKMENGIFRLAPLLDYEFSFIDTYDLYQNPFIKINVNDKTIDKIIKNDSIFQDSINRLMDINIKKLLRITEEKNNISISKELRDIFLYHDKETKKMVKNFFLRK